MVFIAGALVLAAAALSISTAGGTVGHRSARWRGHVARTAAGGTPPFAVGEVMMDFEDPSRRVAYRGRPAEPRPLVTVIRYPALGDPSQVDVPDATPALASGPFPLVVFGHGFRATPATYSRLLRAWARAGYVVAAPVFPLTHAHTPGGAHESDLVNQPRDMSFVITQMLATSSSANGPLAGLVAPDQIAVSGQSDGGSTALAVTYDSHDRDPRVGAAMILSGAEIPGLRGYDFRGPGVPLLSTQGTADISNVPASTFHYFRPAPKPKFLLTLLGAGHLPPYTNEEPQLGIVERVTIAFLDRYLKHMPTARAAMSSAGAVKGVATLSAAP